jgi:hypothetical protein
MNIAMKRNEKNESGLVSIVVVTIIIVILSLMSIGFAKIMDREYHQSIDRELSIQADYAAESGMNDARAYILNAVKNGTDPSTGGTCKDLSVAPTGFVQNGNISGSHTAGNDNVKYSCVIIDPSPKDLKFTVTKGKSVVLKLVPKTAISSLYFSWQNHDAVSDASGNRCFTAFPGAYPKLPKESDITNPCVTGLLEAGVYPVLSGAPLPPDPNTALEANYRSFFMYPQAAGAGNVGTANYLTGGPFVSGRCNKTNTTVHPLALPNQQARDYFYCNSGLSAFAAVPASFMYIKLTAQYRDLDVSIQAGGSSPGPVALGGAEATVDVTGEGNNVLRRLLGYVTLTPDLKLPDYTIQSLDTLCKKIRLPKTGAAPNAYGVAGYDDPAASDASVSSACSANGVLGVLPP